MGRFCEMRGPQGGYARGHAGLERFWKTVRIETKRPLPSQLDSWLANGPPHGLVLGECVTPRRSLLAGWAHAVRQQRSAEVAFVPVSPGYSTATARDVLTLIYGLLRPSASAPLSAGRTPDELRSAIQLACQGVGWVSAFPNEEDAQLVVLVEGVDELIDCAPDDLLLLHGLGVGARVLLAARQHIGLPWRSDEHTVLSLDGLPEAGDTPGSAPKGFAGPSNSATAVVAALAAPATAQTLASLGIDLPAELPPACCRYPDDRVQLARDELRVQHTTAMGVFDRRVVEFGLDLIDADPETQEAIAKDCGYIIDHLGTHMSRLGSNDWMRLVTPGWLHCWKARTKSVLGFLTDVGRARAAATNNCFRAENQNQRAQYLVELVRCQIVEGSILSLEGGRPYRGLDDNRAYRLPLVDWSKTTGADDHRRAAIEAAKTALRPTPVGECFSSERAESEWKRAELTEDVMRVEAFAELALRLPAFRRPAAVAEAMHAFWEFGDTNCWRPLYALAPWMSDADAMSLFSGTFGCGDLDERLTGWAGLVDAYPLLLRLGGKAAVLGAAREVEAVALWLP